MYDRELFLHTLSDFAGRLVTTYDVDDTLQDLAERATAMLDISGSAVSLSSGGRLAFATAVPETVAALEHAQTEA